MKFQLQYVQRACQILWVCTRNLAEMARDRILNRPGTPGPQRLRLFLEELGGSFLKFGQILSLQIDSLPREYCEALRNLLDRVPPFGKEQVRQVFQQEFSKAPDSLFREFNYTPLASASIGQVHRAVLEDSTVVAVKVQRPGIQDVFRRDAVLLRLFVRIIFLFHVRSLYFMRDPVREFNEWLGDELDYRREGTYAQALGRNARETPTEVIPKIHWTHTSSRVLTMDFIVGFSVMEYIRLKEQHDEPRLAELRGIGFDPPQFVANVIHNFMSDAFRFGLFHADLHPANLLILNNNVVGYVDFGIVGHLTPEARRKQIQLSMAYARGSTQELFDAFLNISTLTGGVDLEGFRREMEKRSRLWYREPAIGGVPHLQRSLTVAMVDLLSLCRRHGLLVDREMIKYIRSLFLVDGLVSLIAPGLDLAPQIREVCEDFLADDARRKTLSPGAAISVLADLSGWLTTDPAQMLNALELLNNRNDCRGRRTDAELEVHEDVRARTFAVASVWLFLGTAALAGSQKMPGGIMTGPGYLFIVFWGGWTIWLAILLRRLARQ